MQTIMLFLLIKFTCLRFGKKKMNKKVMNISEIFASPGIQHNNKAKNLFNTKIQLAQLVTVNWVAVYVNKFSPENSAYDSN